MFTGLRKLNLLREVYWFSALAFALRIGERLYLGATDFFNAGYSFFFEIAQSIATGHGIALADHIPTALRVPLYPILLAAITLGHETVWPILIVQSLIGAGTAFGAALLARQMFSGQLGEKAAILSSGITAVYPYYVVHDTALQETSFYTLLTLVPGGL